MAFRTTLTLLAATLTTLSLPTTSAAAASAAAAAAAAADDDYTIMAKQEGLASVYWPGDGQCGEVRADTKPFKPGQCHLAHREWPLGTRVRICSKETGSCAITRVRDRGPYGACDRRGMDPRTHQCRGKWMLKRKPSDPGTWRGIADLTRCVWKRIGGPGLQPVILELLTPWTLDKMFPVAMFDFNWGCPPMILRRKLNWSESLVRR